MAAGVQVLQFSLIQEFYQIRVKMIDDLAVTQVFLIDDGHFIICQNIKPPKKCSIFFFIYHFEMCIILL